MGPNAIHNVTQALEAVIVQAIGPKKIVHVGPLDDPPASDASLVLFLYRIAANADLRNTPHTSPVMAADDVPVVYDRALPLDLHYLLTVGAKAISDELGGLDLLGAAMQALEETPYLVGAAVGGDVVRVTLDSVSNDDMSRIWALFPALNFRTSVAYLATPVWIDPKSPRTRGTPVVQEPHRIGQTPRVESLS